MMTLYMLFEALDAGRLTLATPPARFGLCRFAGAKQARPPAGRGHRRGRCDPRALRQVGERRGRGGGRGARRQRTEFARQMTAKARQIGPDIDDVPQRLGSAGSRAGDDGARHGGSRPRPKRRFPARFAYFGQTSFAYSGKSIRGHNKLIGSVRGVNGIKTGYIRASGFNVVTSVEDAGHRMIVVMMGGKTADERNAHVPRPDRPLSAGDRTRLLSPPSRSIRSS